MNIYICETVYIHTHIPTYIHTGIAVGEAISGVLGKLQPRFCVFGEVLCVKERERERKCVFCKRVCACLGESEWEGKSRKERDKEKIVVFFSRALRGEYFLISDHECCTDTAALPLCLCVCVCVCVCVCLSPLLTLAQDTSFSSND